MAKNYEQRVLDSYLGSGWSEDPFKRTILLNGQGDIATVSGVDNLANAIFRRLKTPIGWYPEFPWYGSRLNDMIGMGNSFENRELVATWIEESLLFEKRLQNGTLNVTVERNSRDYRAVDILINARVVGFANPELFVFSFFLKTGTLVPEIS